MVEERLGNPTPIGLMGLAIGCAALAPAELARTEIGDPMIWLWMLTMAGVLQIYGGIVDLINRNVLGATAFTVYGMLWIVSGLQLSDNSIFGTSEAEVRGYVFIAFLLFTAFMTIGFATVSRTLFIIFISFIVIFAVEAIASFVPAFHGVALFTAGVLHTTSALLCIWAAAGSVINPLLGRNVFNQGAPLIKSHEIAPDADDFESLVRHQSIRRKIICVLYHFWETHAWDFVSTAQVSEVTELRLDELAPDFWYLFQCGMVTVDEEHMLDQPDEPKRVRISAKGIDYYREIQMGKFKF